VQLSQHRVRQAVEMVVKEEMKLHDFTQKGLKCAAKLLPFNDSVIEFWASLTHKTLKPHNWSGSSRPRWHFSVIAGESLDNNQPLERIDSRSSKLKPELNFF
jgi:hypothetical protein